MMVWQVVTEGDRQPREHITTCLEEKHARIAARGYNRYMPKDQDVAVVEPLPVHEHPLAITEYISTPVLERMLAEEDARQGETLLIEHLEEVLDERRGRGA